MIKSNVLRIYRYSIFLPQTRVDRKKGDLARILIGFYNKTVTKLCAPPPAPPSVVSDSMNNNASADQVELDNLRLENRVLKSKLEEKRKRFRQSPLGFTTCPIWTKQMSRAPSYRQYWYNSETKESIWDDEAVVVPHWPDGFDVVKITELSADAFSTFASKYPEQAFNLVSPRNAAGTPAFSFDASSAEDTCRKFVQQIAPYLLNERGIEVPQYDPNDSFTEVLVKMNICVEWLELSRI